MKNQLRFCVLAAFVAACGGSQPPAESAPPAPVAEAAPAPAVTASAAAPAEAPMPEAFDDMNHDQRVTFMKTSVAPKMRDLFQKYDGERFAEFGCTTCHGSSAKDGTFKMPNPELPKLPKSPEGFKALAEKNPAGLKFMKEVVLPTMASLVRQEPFDPATHKGFACGECHTFQN